MARQEARPGERRPKMLKGELENNSTKPRDLTENRHSDGLKLTLSQGKMKKGDDVDDDNCARSCEPGSQCRPNECIIGSGKPRWVGILEWGGIQYEPGEGNGEVSLRATWVRGGRILSQQGGFQVRKGDTNGEQRGMEKSKKKGIILDSL
jgi:hypothetical protein